MMLLESFGMDFFQCLGFKQKDKLLFLIFTVASCHICFYYNIFVVIFLFVWFFLYRIIAFSNFILFYSLQLLCT